MKATIHIDELDYDFLPSKASQAQALMILAHGRTGRKQLLQWISKRFQIPSLAYLAIQAPYPDRREDQSDEGYSWYFYQPNEEDPSLRWKGLDESRSRIQRMIEALLSQDLKPNQIYWLGFSQGGAMGLDLFLRSPHLLGGLICVSGFCVNARAYPDELGPFGRQQRILITHGKRDEIIKLEDAERSFDYIRQSGVTFELEIFDKPHTFQLNQEVPVLEERIKAWMSSQGGNQ